jgi:uncharacterized sporulation protein YeaH/YhbH (DUF444 family)
VLDALDYGRGGERAEGMDPVGRWLPADDEARRLHRDVSDALLDLKDESEPGWVKRVDSGRLNVRRYATADFDPDSLFDRYDPGQMDAAELEVVLLLDVSGSMGSRTTQLGRAAWAIRMAVDDLEGTCTVLTYESGPHRLLAEPGQRPDDRMFIPTSMGGTQPKSALMEAHRVLVESSAKNRLLIVLTDGEWFTGGWHYDGKKLVELDETQPIIESMNASGAVTVMALMGRHAGDDLHGCQFGAHIDKPQELPELFKRVAAERIKGWL